MAGRPRIGDPIVGWAVRLPSSGKIPGTIPVTTERTPMAEHRVPDPTLMARLPLSVKGVEWAAERLAPWQFEQRDGEWSPHQHLFHLIATERQVYLPRLKEMLETEAPKFLFFDNPGFMKENYKREPSINDLAVQFVDARAETLDILKGVGVGDWSRRATWPDGREIDLAWFAEKILWHGLDHFATLLDIHGDVAPLQAPAS